MANDQPDDDLNKDLVLKGERPNRVKSAVALLIAGATYSEIAETLEYPSARSARDACEKAMAHSYAGDDLDKARALQRRRLDRLLRGVWGKATNPKDPDQLSAVKSATAIIDRQIKLQGLDAPTQVVVHNPTQGRIEAWVGAALALKSHELPEEADVIEGEVVAEEERLEDEDRADGQQ